MISLVLPLGALALASVQTSSDLNFNPALWTLANYKYVVIDFPTTRQAIVNSLILGVGTGTIGVACATLIAIAVHRSKSSGRKLLEQVTMLPQAFPRLIFAFGFLWMVLTLPIPLYGTLFAVLLAYIVVFPTAGLSRDERRRGADRPRTRRGRACQRRRQVSGHAHGDGAFVAVGDSGDLGTSFHGVGARNRRFAVSPPVRIRRCWGPRFSVSGIQAACRA
jgi:hypothetical protein